MRKALPRLVEMPNLSHSSSNQLGETEVDKPPGRPLPVATAYGAGHSTQNEDSDIDSEIDEDIFVDEDDSSDEEVGLT